MKQRKFYFLLFLIIFTIEVFIALFVHDKFIRPYIGDVLVTVLLCCLVRCIFLQKIPFVCVWVFIFSLLTELLQLIHICDILNIKNRFLRILIGTSFDFKDILCYFAGCVLFTVVEHLYLKHKNLNA